MNTRIHHMSVDDGLKMITFIGGRVKRQEAERRLSSQDYQEAVEHASAITDERHQYSARGAAVYLDGQRIGQCSEIELPTTEGGSGMEVQPPQHRVGNSTGIVSRGSDGIPVTTSLVIAERVGMEHASVIKLIRTYLTDLQGFGELRFEIRVMTERGHGQATEYAVLNEHQATLILSYMRNSEIVRRFKIALVHAFYEMREQLQKAQQVPTQFQIPQTMAEALRLAADENEGRLKAEQQALEYKDQSEQYQKQIEHQTPWVEFARTVSDTGGNMMVREAAKILDVKPSKLFQHLKDWRWINDKRVPYQNRVDQGYITYRVHNYTKPTGDVSTTYVPLITGKGLKSNREAVREALHPNQYIASG